MHIPFNVFPHCVRLCTIAVEELPEYLSNDPQYQPSTANSFLTTAMKMTQFVATMLSSPLGKNPIVKVLSLSFARMCFHSSNVFSFTRATTPRNSLQSEGSYCAQLVIGKALSVANIVSAIAFTYLCPASMMARSLLAVEALPYVCMGVNRCMTYLKDVDLAESLG